MLSFRRFLTENADKALEDSSANVRAKAIQHPSVTTEHITKALEDTDPEIRHRVILHPKANADHCLGL